MSALRDHWPPLAVVSGRARVPSVSGASLGSVGDDLPPYTQSASELVPGGLADHESEVRRKRSGAPEGAGLEELPDGVGLAAQVPQGDDLSGS